jgi:hypothetical protein
MPTTSRRDELCVAEPTCNLRIPRGSRSCRGARYKECLVLIVPNKRAHLLWELKPSMSFNRGLKCTSLLIDLHPNARQLVRWGVFP